MVEQLEANNEALAAQRPAASGAAASDSAAVATWQLKYEQAAARVEQLELEVERQSIRGGYNPLDTKVIHFKYNPLRAAVEKEERSVGEIKRENEALKARYTLTTVNCDDMKMSGQRSVVHEKINIFC
jgi:hypothetical protein